MNSEKIGSFIKKLREKNNYTQKDLAEKLFVTRQSVSKWENGNTLPSTDTFKLLSELFNVSIDELLLGEYITKNVNSKKEEVKYLLIDENIKNRIKNKRLIILSICSIVLLVFISLLYYFLINFNSMKIYSLTGEKDGLTIKNGIVVSTNEKHYIYIGDLYGINESQVTRMKLYYKDDNKNIMIYASDFFDSHMIIEDNNYSEYIDTSINEIIDDLYLQIEYDNNVVNIKLKAKREYSNNKLKLEKGKKIGQTTTTTIKILDSNKDLNEKLEKIFEKKDVIKYNDGKYKYEIKFLNDNKKVYIDKFDEKRYTRFSGYYTLYGNNFYELSFEYGYVNCKKEKDKCSKNLEKELDFMFEIIEKEARNL